MYNNRPTIETSTTSYQADNMIPVQRNPIENATTRRTTTTTTTTASDTKQQGTFRCSGCKESKPRHLYRKTEIDKGDDYRRCNSCLIRKCGGCGKFLRTESFRKVEYERGDGVGLCNNCLCCNMKKQPALKRKFDDIGSRDTTMLKESEEVKHKEVKSDEVTFDEVDVGENVSRNSLLESANQESDISGTTKIKNDGSSVFNNSSIDETEATVNRIFMDQVLTYHNKQKKIEQSDSYTMDPNEQILMRNFFNTFEWTTPSRIFQSNTESKEASMSVENNISVNHRQITSIRPQDMESIPPASLYNGVSIPEENESSSSMTSTSIWKQNTESTTSEYYNSKASIPEENGIKTTDTTYIPVWRQNTDSFASKLYKESLTSPVEHDMWFDCMQDTSLLEDSDHVESASNNEESMLSDDDISTNSNMTTTASLP